MPLSSIPFSISGLSLGRDAKRIFFVGTQERRELVRYDAKSREFVPFLSGIPARWVSFSRDGQWVAYAAVPAPALDELWRGRADGTEQLQLSFPPMYVSPPRWSPESKRIAFAGALRDDWKVYVVSADASGLEALAEGGTPDWSPDGETLVFDKGELIGTPQYQSSLWLLNLQTRGLKRLPGLKASKTPPGRRTATVWPQRLWTIIGSCSSTSALKPGENWLGPRHFTVSSGPTTERTSTTRICSQAAISLSFAFE